MTLRFRAAARSDTGLVRRRDEDAYLIDAALGLFALADGVGGHRAGDVASRIAVETLADVVRSRGPREAGGPIDGPALLRSAFQIADERIHASAEASTERSGMATTLVAIYAPRSSAWVAHVGDSRAHLWRRGSLTCLTQDHSAVAELARQSPDIDVALLRNSPLAHVLTRSVGSGGNGAPDILPISLEPGDRVLLCCDGLTDMVTDHDIADVLARAVDPEGCCQRLVEAANDAGGRDNVTVLIVDVEEEEA